MERAAVNWQRGDWRSFVQRLTQVQLSDARMYTPIVVPGDSLQVGADGTKVALLRPDHTVHFQPIEVGRDYGDKLEVLSGLSEGDTIVPRPGDAIREGVRGEPVVAEKQGDRAGKK